VCMLLDRFFSILSMPSDVKLEPFPWKDDLKKVSPSLEDAAGSAEIGTPEMESFAYDFIEDHHKNAVHAGGLPYDGDSKTPPGNPSHFQLVLSQADTAVVVAACKGQKISVTAAVHAALAETVFALSPENGASQYTTVMSVNMRPYLQPPYNTRDHACQTYVAGMTPSVYRASTFLEKGVALTTYYKNVYSEKLMQSLRLIGRHHANALFAPRPAVAPPPKLPSSVSLSSLGIIENNIAGNYDSGTVQVVDFKFGVSIMTRQMLLYVWTFRGQLHLSVNFNKAYHDLAQVRTFLMRIKYVLEKGLSLGTLDHTLYHDTH
jgi:hypothetical protein